jgi:hypothetical protein
MTKSNIIAKIDKLTGYYDKLEYLNGCFLKAKTTEQEEMILQMIEQLKFFGR